MAGVYISPDGNREVWEEKPEGYYTEEEWYELNPEEAPGPEPAGPTEEEILEEKKRLVQILIKHFLEQCDFCVLPDSPYTEEELTEIKAFRQALRNLSKQEGYPWDGGRFFDISITFENTTIPWPPLPEILQDVVTDYR